VRAFVQECVNDRSYYCIGRYQTTGCSYLGCILLNKLDVFVADGGDVVVVIRVDRAVATFHFEGQSARQAEGTQQRAQQFKNAAFSQRIMDGLVLRFLWRAVLDYLEVGHRKRAMPSALSGGEAQRVAIARALANRPRIILADEPTAALDSQRARIVMDMLRKVAVDQDAAILAVTHDDKIFDRFDKIFQLRDGRLEKEVTVNPRFSAQPVLSGEHVT